MKKRKEILKNTGHEERAQFMNHAACLAARV